MKVKPPLFDPLPQRDNDYDIQAKPRNLLSDLDFAASKVWRSELERRLPFQNLQVPVYQHICNIYLGNCSCMSFFKKGQPYFCKHLYAIHAAQRNLKSPAQILKCCQYITPTLTTYLAEVFQIQPPRPMYNYCPQDLINDMISQSYEATATELQLAAEGQLLGKINSIQSRNTSETSST